MKFLPKLGLVVVSFAFLLIGFGATLEIFTDIEIRLIFTIWCIGCFAFLCFDNDD